MAASCDSTRSSEGAAFSAGTAKVNPTRLHLRCPSISTSPKPYELRVKKVMVCGCIQFVLYGAPKCCHPLPPLFARSYLQPQLLSAPEIPPVAAETNLKTGPIVSMPAPFSVILFAQNPSVQACTACQEPSLTTNKVCPLLMKTASSPYETIDNMMVWGQDAKSFTTAQDHILCDTNCKSNHIIFPSHHRASIGDATPQMENRKHKVQKRAIPQVHKSLTTWS